MRAIDMIDEPHWDEDHDLHDANKAAHDLAQKALLVDKHFYLTERQALRGQEPGPSLAARWALANEYRDALRRYEEQAREA